MMTQFDAEMLAVKYHDGQTYNGSPYWRHLNDVHNMLKRMGKNDDEVLQVGWLHDIIEDTDMTIDDLFTMGFSERVVAAVKCLTHDSENESYESYLEIVNSNPIARVVKLEHEMH